MPPDDALTAAIDGIFDDLRAGRTSPQRTRAAQRGLEAAFAVFSERGYAGATTRVIAQRADIAEKTLFAHFPSKAVLYAEALRPHLEALLGPAGFVGLLPLITDESLSVEERFAALARNRLALVRSRPGFLRLLVREALTQDPLRDAFIKYWSESVGPLILARLGEARENGTLADEEPRRLLLLLMSGILGYASWSTFIAPSADLDDEAELEALVSLIIKGVGPT